MDLAHACQPGIQFGQSAFKYLAMARILHRLELLQDAAAGQMNGFLLLLPGGLLRRKSLFRFTLCDGRSLLLLYRFAFPSSGHGSIIASADPSGDSPHFLLEPFREDTSQC